MDSPPQSGSKYHFVTYTGAPTSDPVARKLAKQNVMRHIQRRSKKTPLVTRRDVPLKCDLDIPQGFITKAIYSSERNFDGNQTPSSSDDVLAGSNDTHSLIKIADKSMEMPIKRNLSISRLGSGRSDPFIKFPIDLTSRSRELIDFMFDQRVGKASPLKVLWFQIGLLDAAAFHQLLSAAATYFNVMRHGESDKDSGQAVGEPLAHHAHSLQLVNYQMREEGAATTDGIIASIIGFASYYHFNEDMENWKKHLAGLKQIVDLRGGIGTLDPQSSLRVMLSCIDISGSCTLDEVPNFPLPIDLVIPVLPRRFPIKPYSSYHHQMGLLSSTFANSLGLIDCVTDLVLQSLHLQGEIQNTQGRVFIDSMYVIEHMNPILHKLLSLPRQDGLSPIDIMAEMLRLAAILYLIAIRQSFGIYPTRVTVQIRKLCALIIALEGRSEQGIWKDHNSELLELWILTVGAVTSDEKDTANWFAQRLHACMRRLSVCTYGDLEDKLGGFSWIDEIHGTLLGALRESLIAGH